MQSVTRYSRIQKISWIRFIFLLLAFIASVAYAAPLDRRGDQPPVNVAFVTAQEGLIGEKHVPVGDRARVKSEATKPAQGRVLALLQLIQDQRLVHVGAFPDLSLPVPIYKTIKWNPHNFFYLKPMAGNDAREMTFFRILTDGKPKYIAWIAYGIDGKSGASTYASVMEVVTDGKKVREGKVKELKEVARLTGKTDAERKQWTSLHERFRFKMRNYSAVEFVPTEEKNWIAGPAAPDEVSQKPLKITFVKSNGDDMTMVAPPETISEGTEAMKLVVQKLLRFGIPSLHLLNPLPEHLPWPWTDRTVFYPGYDRNVPRGMAFLRLERGVFVAYAWIAYTHNEHLCASIMKEDGSGIQELARVMDVEDNKEWGEFNHKFFGRASFLENLPFRPAPQKAWMSSSHMEVAEVLETLHKEPLDWVKEEWGYVRNNAATRQ
ncbi:hypothetical protein BDP27DRAFT_1496654 [Rhodocollybia butyracea]|uniref:Amine oxidase n=1 Tax=Rhodocollybia butyracea TaxID=206335 RepID=A0A9P5PZ15_9AGAR|nr:hypothetical protein BDP27DRAFT_1496654 [Rhodocollybia butyracea]